jgi:hypothetical protein
MKFKEALRTLAPGFLLSLYKQRYAHENPALFRFESAHADDVKSDIQRKYRHDSDLLEVFVRNKGQMVNKWHHYIPLYDRYFSPFKGQKIRLLEIGAGAGGSLQMWRDYFGDDAIIYGIDINPGCAAFDGIAGQVRIGSQADQAFLESVVKEMGGIDIVLDDGSHHMKDVSSTLEYLFPSLSDGGLYMIEDMHTAYWSRFGGGFGSSSNVFRLLISVVDDMHHWYHKKPIRNPLISKSCTGIHIHDSLVVLEKAQVFPPVHSAVR